MVKVKILLEIKEEYLDNFLEELKYFDAKHYAILRLKVNGKEVKV